MEITFACSLQGLPGDQKRDIHLTLHAELDCITTTKLHYAMSRLLCPRHDYMYQASLHFTALGYMKAHYEGELLYTNSPCLEWNLLSG